MELHPIVDSSDSSPLNSGLWYVASCDSDDVAPSARVGATCTFDPVNRKVVVIGGADPDGAHADVFELGLNGNFRWEGGNKDGLKARYEHAAFKSASHPKSIFIFGGADVNGNSNSIQMLDIESGLWSTPAISGSPPSPRTYRVSDSACHGDDFYVFSGGDAGSQPVGDRQLHCFDASNMRWHTLSAKGTSPKPRHGHSVVVMGGKVVIFGGMSGHTFYNDVTLFDLAKKEWSTTKTTRTSWPSPRAGHGAVVLDLHRMAVFGGMNGQGALDDLWILDSHDWKWTEVKSDGPPPASRLDFAMTRVCLDQSADTVGSNETVATEGSTAGGDLNSINGGDSSASSSTSAARESKETSVSNGVGITIQSIMSAEDDSDVRLVTEEGDVVTERGDAIDGAASMSAANSVVASAPSAARTAPTVVLSEDRNPGMPVTQVNSKTMAITSYSTSSSTSIILIFGGMDTEGEIFDDCLLFRL